MEEVRYVMNTHLAEDPVPDAYTLKQAETVRAFHAGFPEYAVTELRSLDTLADMLGLGRMYVKDESTRFGLNAFKVLGGSWCIGSLIAEKAGIPPEELSFERLMKPDARQIMKDLTVVTATDGNHGRGVAWTAGKLGLKAVVYMPEATAPERLLNIRKLGADARILDLIYDDTVRYAKEQAEKNGWILVQDTAWEGYEEIPARIMQGYLTMALEAAEQLKDTIPTHIFLQAGVGSMAAALAAFFSSYYEKKPKIILVEPNGADCFYQTAYADDGQLHAVRDLHTIMAGLCCGEASTLAWDILKRYACCFVSMPDYFAADGMRILGSPAGNDARIISGESGASAFGLAVKLMRDEALADLRERLSLGKDSRVLCFSTEGDTDRENYRRIVWEGAYAKG